jgi:hypothetical protein
VGIKHPRKPLDVRDPFIPAGSRKMHKLPSSPGCGPATPVMESAMSAGEQAMPLRAIASATSRLTAAWASISSAETSAGTVLFDETLQR